MFSKSEVETFARRILAIFMESRGIAYSGMPSQSLLVKYGASRIWEFQEGLKEALDRGWVETNGSFIWMTEKGKATLM